MPVKIDNQGRKDDAGKDPWHLMPFDALRGILKVLAFGANKYAPRNWERGMDWSRPFSALMRHMTAWHDGEKADPETGYSHLWHAGCCILFLIAFEIRGIGNDDRAKPAEKPSDTWPEIRDVDQSWADAANTLRTQVVGKDGDPVQLSFPFDNPPKPIIR